MIETQGPFWLQQALEREQPAPATALAADIEADICIVGGGYTGLWSAIRLKQAEPALNIVVLERELCGSGASGRNGGCLLTWSTKYPSLRRRFGSREAARLVRASEQAVLDIRDFCEQHNIDAELRIDGACYTATNDAQCGVMAPLVARLERESLNSWSALSEAELQTRTGSEAHLEGHFSPFAGSVQPALLVRGLRRVALTLGIQIFEHSPMTALHRGKPSRIDTADGSVTAGKVILALNAWTPSLFREFDRHLVLVSSDMAITRPVPAELRRLGLDHGAAVVDGRTFVHYYRTTPDGRLMLGKGGNLFAFGNRVIEAFDQPSRYRPMLKAALQRFFPDLKTEIAATWTGPSDRSASGLPFFGRLEGDGDIYYGMGYSGNGVVQSLLGARILTSLVLGRDDDWARCGLARGPQERFPPEPVRWLGAMTVRNAIRRKENAEDRGETPFIWDRWLARFADAAGKADKG
ncbi:putative aminophosphonate oxidoreductase [Oceanisphaera litoralis]|uniref:FAD-dependent oxidoreductase n=1 Tax=Oceanisphaera litoralis TaxID=225144 RepID=UPI0019561AF5|nr:FAD-dependent oxidoreductase [Oceanisphaera litoralis]MBM7457193.1 putative aminophosphonate oxidoreductase [Oceanisphaera litoralis]